MRRPIAMNPTPEIGFMKAMQFALTEYVCVSTEDDDDASPDDDIQACYFDFFRKEVIITILIPFLPV